MVAVQRVTVAILACDRPGLLHHTLASLRRTTVPKGWEMDCLLVDNSEGPFGRAEADRALERGDVGLLIRPGHNVGIAAGWNLAWQAANAEDVFRGVPPPEVFVLLQDDVELRPEWLVSCIDALTAWPGVVLVSGYNSPKHQTTGKLRKGDLRLYVKKTLPGVHLVAHRKFWTGVFPILVRAHHLDEDWWITRDSPGAPPEIHKAQGVIPGLARHLGTSASTWRPEPHLEYDDPVAEV